MTSPEITIILQRLGELHADLREMRRDSGAEHQAVREDLAALVERVERVETRDQAELGRVEGRRRICRQAAALATGAAAFGAAVVSVLAGAGLLP